eukprot:9476901-Pyramimonas_sp.AAC.1
MPRETGSNGGGEAHGGGGKARDEWRDVNRGSGGVREVMRGGRGDEWRAWSPPRAPSRCAEEIIRGWGGGNRNGKCRSFAAGAMEAGMVEGEGALSRSDMAKIVYASRIPTSPS